MSFFGFDATLPRDRGHPVNAPGFSQAADPFAQVSQSQSDAQDDDDALDFEDTYDGLGDQLDESQDAFNADTFGGTDSGPKVQKPVGRDFDFFGQTAEVSNAFNEEQERFRRQQPPPKSIPSIEKPANKATKTGYEQYKDPGYIPDLQVNANLWGVPARKTVNDARGAQEQQQSQGAAPVKAATEKKMMSLEEVEAAMRAKRKKPVIAEQAASVQGVQQSQQSFQPLPFSTHQGPSASPQHSHSQKNSQARLQVSAPQQPVQAELPSFAVNHPQILQRHHQAPSKPARAKAPPPAAAPAPPAALHPKQILQNPNRASVPSPQPGPAPVELPQNQHRRPPSGPGAFISPPAIATHPNDLSEEQRAAFMNEEAKRAKRIQKIHHLSKGNGLMVPYEKNFIVRIQLQQLVSATGNPSDQDGDNFLNEDFYYQVHSQIRSGPRQTPHQPLNQFAQTYLFQTGGRAGGGGGRRLNRGGDTHQQRMEQQVQRAVEAAKLKPKNKQLVIEGSLGKISFSNAKTPKPLLNIKRPEAGQDASRTGTGKSLHPAPKASDRNTILSHIENVYSIVMSMEDLERSIPPARETTEGKVAQLDEGWSQEMKILNDKMWRETGVMDPILPDSLVPHPFIAFISYAKGKKVIPRVFRHLDQNQRDTVVTMLIFHVGVLDVVRLAQLRPGEHQLPTAVREEVELFSQAVMPSLFGYISEAPLGFVVGLSAILLDRVDVRALARTKVGLTILTMFLSRAELIRQAGGINPEEWQQWSTSYGRLFDALEPVLGAIFPGSINSGEDIYVWQFLAAMGVGANEGQQQRLVMAVSERVRETVSQSKTLPPELSAVRLDNVNLFLRAIGLDVELLG
ncbi:MAG: hypothetical protein M1825_002483 [Sarcosagium campestre]|nr:MAG: hypothetical protein M1825_002483 [Sarcosagium campestre]